MGVRCGEACAVIPERAPPFLGSLQWLTSVTEATNGRVPLTPPFAFYSFVAFPSSLSPVPLPSASP